MFRLVEASHSNVLRGARLPLIQVPLVERSEACGKTQSQASHDVVPPRTRFALKLESHQRRFLRARLQDAIQKLGVNPSLLHKHKNACGDVQWMDSSCGGLKGDEPAFFRFWEANA